MKKEMTVTIIVSMFYTLLATSAHAACGLKWNPVIVDKANNVQAVIDYDESIAKQTSGVIFFKTRLCRINEGKKSSMPIQVKAEHVTFEGNCKEYLGRAMQDIEISKKGQITKKEVTEDFVSLYTETNMSKLFSEACKAAGMR